MADFHYIADGNLRKDLEIHFGAFTDCEIIKLYCLLSGFSGRILNSDVSLEDLWCLLNKWHKAWRKPPCCDGSFPYQYELDKWEAKYCANYDLTIDESPVGSTSPCHQSCDDLESHPLGDQVSIET